MQGQSSKCEPLTLRLTHWATPIPTETATRVSLPPRPEQHAHSTTLGLMPREQCDQQKLMEPGPA